MNDISAAIGISQLKKIKKFLKKRNEIAKFYKKLLKDLPIKVQKILPENYSSYHLFIIQLDLNHFKFSYSKIFKLLRKKKYYVNLHYMPIHLSPYFKKIGFRKGQYPVSEKYGKTALSIPIYFGLKLNEIKKFIKVLKGTIENKK